MFSMHRRPGAALFRARRDGSEAARGARAHSAWGGRGAEQNDGRRHIFTGKLPTRACPQRILPLAGCTRTVAASTKITAKRQS